MNDRFIAILPFSFFANENCLVNISWISHRALNLSPVRKRINAIKRVIRVSAFHAYIRYLRQGRFQKRRRITANPGYGRPWCGVGVVLLRAREQFNVAADVIQPGWSLAGAIRVRIQINVKKKNTKYTSVFKAQTLCQRDSSC